MTYDKENLEFREITNGDDWTKEEVQSLMKDTIQAALICTDDLDLTLNMFNSIRVACITKPEIVRNIFTEENLLGFKKISEVSKDRKPTMKEILQAFPKIKDYLPNIAADFITGENMDFMSKFKSMFT